MEEQASSTNGANYSVGNFYKKSWEVIKKNLSQLAIITIIGVLINVALSALIIFVIVNNLFDSWSGWIAGILVGAVVNIVAGTFVGLLQLIALKKVSEGQKLETNEVMSEAWRFVPRALMYSLFVVGIFIAAGIVTGLLSAAVGALGILAGLAILVAAVIAAFRYVFVPFLIVEPKETAFLERFNISERMTRGIYGTIFLVWLVGLLLAIGGGIVGSILSAPFSEKTRVNNSASITIDYNNVQSAEDFQSQIQDAADDAGKENFSGKYLIAQVITQAISWGIGLVIIGAMLELYKQRKHVS